MEVDNFIKKIEEIKGKNSLDISAYEDLSIALMNLISLEEHFIFSYMKTSEKKYIEIENKIFGYNGNTNAKEMVKLANEYSRYFEARVITSPTLAQIKDEIKAKKPVIALVYGFKLQNPRILFSRGGSYYHTFVIKGFDDKTQEFIVNDNGDLKKGLDLRYSYDTIMDALADYSHKTKTTVKPATALFTSQRMLVKTKASDKIWLIKNGHKHHISSARVLKNHGWKWNLVTVVDKDWLDNFPTGPAI